MQQAKASSSVSPLVTIITVNRNNIMGLHATLDSVVTQDFTNFEHIVIDGGSDDGSAELIGKYPHLSPSSITEPDKGIYNAMNKGITRAKGEYILFLNSGDELHDNGVLANIVQHLAGHDLIYGRDTLVKADGTRWLKPYPDLMTFSFMFRDTLPHSATFIRKQIFGTVGLYDEDMRICSDWKFFMLALFKHGCSSLYAPVPVSIFGLDGISADPTNFELVRTERQQVVDQYFPRLKSDLEELNHLRREQTDFRTLKEHLATSRLLQILRGFGLLRFMDELVPR
jgi:glycosyltransferase involved in cell wall biosynthesis